MTKDSTTEGIALIGFGSSRPYNKEAMMYCIDILKKEGVKNTYFSFIGREEPTIEDMMKKVFDDGIEKLTVIPFLMSTGEMSIKYIPDRMGIN
jgi:sirohydrochlorin ferrochelatase